MQVEYPDDKSREDWNSKVTSFMNNNGLRQEIVEATEFRDYSDEIIDLPLFSANKLIDQAEQSLDKLSHM